MHSGKFKSVDNKVDFIGLEHEMLEKWESDNIFRRRAPSAVPLPPLPRTAG